MKKQLRYIMQDQVHHKVAAIMDDRANHPDSGQKGFLIPSLLLAALILVQILLSASTT